MLPWQLSIAVRLVGFLVGVAIFALPDRFAPRSWPRGPLLTRVWGLAFALFWGWALVDDYLALSGPSR